MGNEYKKWQSSPPKDIRPIADDDHMSTKWMFWVDGPSGSLFDGGSWKIEMLLNNYPFNAPTLRFISEIYHPNVDTDGKLCENVIGEWSPTQKMTEIADKLATVLLHIDPSNPQRQDLAVEFEQNNA